MKHRMERDIYLVVMDCSMYGTVWNGYFVWERWIVVWHCSVGGVAHLWKEDFTCGLWIVV